MEYSDTNNESTMTEDQFQRVLNAVSVQNKGANSPARPPHILYTDIHSDKQEINTPSVLYICRKRALFAEFPPQQHTEVMELDMIYGLLHHLVRERIPRESFTTYEQLVMKARIVDVSMMKDEENIKCCNIINRCTYCNESGHVTLDCPKLTNALRKAAARQQEAGREVIRPQEQISCVACRKAYVGTHCPHCTTRPIVHYSSLEYLNSDCKTAQPVETNENKIKPKVKLNKRCRKCRRFGHLTENCRKIKNQVKVEINMEDPLREILNNLI